MKQAIIVLAIVFTACTSTQINQAFSDANKVLTTEQPLTSSEVGEGLKEALVKGISLGADRVSQTDGYLKNPQIMIPFPPDVKKVEERLRQLGLGNQVDNFVTTLNRGAEDAAKEAKPIFISAIRQMTIDDAWGILKGQPDAATQFLKRTTSSQLKEKFKPVIQNSLDKVSATKYYGDLVNTYNKIPFVDKVNPDLNEYATDLAMQGLFTMIAGEEKKIRENPLERTTELLKRVFGYEKK
ncbi:MAG: DUF4197 domain-containing protein [Cyclobacteriaceae bacterium]|nr:DUF4197 domain-containing protein [Cyclobacteriaceae bacterium]